MAGDVCEEFDPSLYDEEEMILVPIRLKQRRRRRVSRVAHGAFHTSIAQISIFDIGTPRVIMRPT